MKLRFFSPRMKSCVPGALVMLSAVVAVVAYLQALHYPFVSDDTVYLTENAKLSGLHLSELWRLLTEPYNRYEFLPLRDLSYWLDLTLFGLNPVAFRLHNILLYLLCLPLVFVTTLGLWRYFRPVAADAPWAAAVVTTLFALHLRTSKRWSGSAAARTSCRACSRYWRCTLRYMPETQIPET